MRNQTNHYKNERYSREKFIDEHIGNDGYIIDGFVVDKGHPNGVEVHSITDKGIIIVHNYRTGKLVTKLLARPQQIKRYYEQTGRKHPPEYLDILELAYQHQCLGYNNM